MQREDVQQLCTNAVDEFKRNARTLRRDTEAVDHYVVYNACKRVLYMYPDVCCPCSTSLHDSHSNTSSTTLRLLTTLQWHFRPLCWSKARCRTRPRCARGCSSRKATSSRVIRDLCAACFVGNKVVPLNQTNHRCMTYTAVTVSCCCICFSCRSSPMRGTRGASARGSSQSVGTRGTHVMACEDRSM